MALFIKGLITLPDKNTIKIVLLFTLATFCLFQAINIWGANYSALFLDLAVAVPVVLAVLRKEIINSAVYLTFLLAVFGTMLALKIFSGGEIIWTGLLWSLGALVANGLFIEYAKDAIQAKWNKVFWMSLGLVIVGLVSFSEVLSLQTIEIQYYWLLVILFALSTGILNFYFAFLAFENLKPIEVGVLILGVTPSIILASYFMLGKSLSVDQILGVAITLLATMIFGRFLSKI
ncbi:MAG: hypothetical protein UZ19_OD1000275 [Parcubacteria bacterium OLB19]|nr:MAG: hypothetical protein UZ19_OD1000275 [Parcubacteria bacterium OLB19]